jgi:hypothetical protein
LEDLIWNGSEEIGEGELPISQNEKPIAGIPLQAQLNISRC